MNGINSQDAIGCPLHQKATLDTKNIRFVAASKKPWWTRVFFKTKSIFNFFFLSIPNSYYLGHKSKVYDFISNLIKEGSKSLKPLICVSSLVGRYCFVNQPQIIKVMLKEPRLGEGDLLGEGRQLRVIAEALGRYRISKERQDMKQKRGIIAQLLSKPEKHIPDMLLLADKLSESWCSSNTLHSHVITQDLREFTVAVYLQSVMQYKGPIRPLTELLEKQIDLLGKRLIYKKPRHFEKKFRQLRDELVEYLIADEGVQNTTEYTKKLSEYIDIHYKNQQADAFATGLNGAVLAGYLAPMPAFIATVYEMGKNDVYQDQIINEWLSQEEKGVSKIDYIKKEDTLLHAIVHEVLRLHPSQPFVFRQATQDCLINDEHFVPKKTQIIFNFYHALRDPSIWGNDATTFRPERFVENADLYQLPFLVYSTGPNNCTGQIFSRLSLKAFLLSMVLRLHWKTLNTIQHQFYFALTFDKDVEISLKKRY